MTVSLMIKALFPVVEAVASVVVVVVLVLMVVVAVVVAVVVVVVVIPRKWYVVIAQCDQNPFAQWHHHHAEATRNHCLCGYQQFSQLYRRPLLLNADLRR